MPIYEYECQRCDKVFETIRKFSDPPLTECLCEEKAPVTKLVSAAAFHLKGTGWYVTDFRDKNKSGKAGDAADAGGDQSGSDGSGKPDSAAGAEPSKEKKDVKGGGSGESKSTGGSSSSTAPSGAAAG